MQVPAAGGQQVRAAPGGPGTAGVCVQSCHLGATGFTSSFQGDGLDPWDSEPPGGMFPPGPAQLPCPNPSLGGFQKLWMNLKPTRLQSPIYSSPFGV